MPTDVLIECQQSQDAYATAHTIYNIFIFRYLPKNPKEIQESINAIEELDNDFKELLLDMLGFNPDSEYTIIMNDESIPGNQTFLNLFGDNLKTRIDQYLNSLKQETSPL